MKTFNDLNKVETKILNKVAHLVGEFDGYDTREIIMVVRTDSGLATEEVRGYLSQLVQKEYLKPYEMPVNGERFKSYELTEKFHAESNAVEIQTPDEGDDILPARKNVEEADDLEAAVNRFMDMYECGKADEVADEYHQWPRQKKKDFIQALETSEHPIEAQCSLAFTLLELTA